MQVMWIPAYAGIARIRMAICCVTYNVTKNVVVNAINIVIRICTINCKGGFNER